MKNKLDENIFEDYNIKDDLRTSVFNALSDIVSDYRRYGITKNDIMSMVNKFFQQHKNI